MTPKEIKLALQNSGYPTYKINLLESVGDDACFRFFCEEMAGRKVNDDDVLAAFYFYIAGWRDSAGFLAGKIKPTI